jgi:pantetheine-phosphate adenylyltransferase
MQPIALYVGSFDPVTNGHIDVVRHAAKLASRLVIAVGVHPGKVPLFSADERLAMITETCADMVRGLGCAFDCMTFDDLAVATARRVGATMMIRGLRDGTDLDYEMQLAGMNAQMAPEVQTVFLPASPLVRPITATLVRQIAAMGGDTSAFVPPGVASRLEKKFPAKVHAGKTRTDKAATERKVP